MSYLEKEHTYKVSGPCVESSCGFFCIINIVNAEKTTIIKYKVSIKGLH